MISGFLDVILFELLHLLVAIASKPPPMSVLLFGTSLDKRVAFKNLVVFVASSFKRSLFLFVHFRGKILLLSRSRGTATFLY